MKTLFFSSLLLCCVCTLQAQQKGGIPLPSEGAAGAGNTYALIVGISDYEYLPDLQYADRDARAFAEFLQSPSGGNVPLENIQLLTNEQATGGVVNLAIYGFISDCKPGDKVIIYFSGHGDMETKIVNSPGFLLCHDAPSFAYMSGGTLQVNNLQDMVNTLVQDNKTQVLLITDACRAGRLAGSSINGAGATTANLQQFNNAIKILSCQPNEYSIEGAQWGGGRGAFSYHLIDALYGLADDNQDAVIKLREVDRYLEDHVPVETAPQSQNPIVLGDKEAKLAIVFQEVLSQQKAKKAMEYGGLSKVEGRGLVEKVLAAADTVSRQLYRDFELALGRQRFLEPADSSADHYFRQMLGRDDLADIHGLLTRNYAAALIDDGQRWINGFLQSTIEGSQWNHPRGYGRHFAKAAELLGKDHYLYGNLKGKECFFNARDFYLDARDIHGTWGTKGTKQTFKSILKKGIDYDERAPYLYYLLDYLYGLSSNKKELQKGISLLEKALELSPSWVRANWTLALRYDRLGNSPKMKEYFKKAIHYDVDRKDPYLGQMIGFLAQGMYLHEFIEMQHHYSFDTSSVNYLSGLASIYEQTHQFEKAKEFYEKTLEQVKLMPEEKEEDFLNKGNQFWWNGDLENAAKYIEKYINTVQASGDTNAIRRLARRYQAYNQLGCVKIVHGNYEDAAFWFTKRDQSSSAAYGYDWKAWIAFSKGDLKRTETLLDQHFSKNKNSIAPFELTGDIKFLTGVYDLVDYGIFNLEVAVKYFPKEPDIHFTLGRLYAEQKQDAQKAIPYLRKASRLRPLYEFYHYRLAAAYAQAGHTRKAIHSLKKAVKRGFEEYKALEDDPSVRALRGLEGYFDIIKG